MSEANKELVRRHFEEAVSAPRCGIAAIVRE